MKINVVVALLVGALVLGFAGGIVGGLVFAPKGDGDTQELTSRIVKLEERQAAVEGRVAGITQGGSGLKVGVVDAETLFTRVFLPQVEAERAAMTAKAEDIQDLQADYAAGKIEPDQYQQRYLRLQAEYIQAALKVNLVMLDKMIASPGFLNLRADLENVRTQAKPITDEVEKAVREAQVTILDPQGFSERLTELRAAFQQLDQLLTQVAAVKILEISQQVAKEKGYDLVLRTKDVVLYRREGAVVDLSADVEQRLWNLFPAR
ncbi:MAG: OmpH family outer membrane protein [Candidatus Acetothermia bacterium]|nr:OmpH family outer membrane protein [Candidatus Acetothermia bacterium]